MRDFPPGLRPRFCLIWELVCVSVCVCHRVGACCVWFFIATDPHPIRTPGSLKVPQPVWWPRPGSLCLLGGHMGH